MKKPLKIGIVCPYDMYRFGGVQEQVKLHAAELRRRGHQVKILAPTTLEQDTAKDPDIIELGRATKTTISRTRFEMAISAEPGEIKGILESENFDLLHCHEPLLPMLARQIISAATCPVVATFHARQPESLGGRSIEMLASPYGRTMSSGISKFVAVSEPATAMARSITDQTVEIIPNTLDLSQWSPDECGFYSDFNDGVRTIAYVGRLEKRKGVAQLLKAYNRLQHIASERVRLVIAGDGDDRRGLERYCQDHGLSDVHFLGFISDQDKKALLRTAALACFPALYGESFGIVLIEAMAMGAPVVAGDNDGYQSVMTGLGQLGVVSPKASDDFARRLKILLEQEPLRQQLIGWQKSTLPQYDIRVAIDKYLDVYDSALTDQS